MNSNFRGENVHDKSPTPESWNNSNNNNNNNNNKNKNKKNISPKKTSSRFSLTNKKSEVNKKPTVQIVPTKKKRTPSPKIIKGVHREKNGKIIKVSENEVSQNAKTINKRRNSPGILKQFNRRKIEHLQLNDSGKIVRVKPNSAGRQSKAARKTSPTVLTAAQVARRNANKPVLKRTTSSSKKLYGHTEANMMELLKNKAGIIFKRTNKISKKELESLGGDIVSVRSKGYFKLYYEKNGKLYRIFKEISPYTYIVKGSTGKNNRYNTLENFLKYYPNILKRKINKQERKEIINNNNNNR